MPIDSPLAFANAGGGIGGGDSGGAVVLVNTGQGRQPLDLRQAVPDFFPKVAVL